METRGFGLTLFDISSYLFPGFVMLLCISIIESSFFGTNYLCMDLLFSNIISTAIFAYFLGHICYSTSSIVRNLLFSFCHKTMQIGESNKNLIAKTAQWIYSKVLHGKEFQLDENFIQNVDKLLYKIYNLDPKKKKHISRLERYILADNFNMVSGAENERASLVVREGFYKSSMVSLGIMTLIILFSLFSGGLAININNTDKIQLGLNFSLLLSILFFSLTIIFRNRYKFFNRLKINNTYIIFLAYNSLNK